MCGIVGYIGDKSATPLLIEGLKRLEYRGYDSAGVAVVNHGASISSLGPQLLGMGVWAVITFLLAIRLFNWE